MTLRIEDCPPELQAKLKLALKQQYNVVDEEQVYAMATFLKGEWSIGPPTYNKRLVSRLTHSFNISTPQHAHQTTIGKPPAIVVILKDASV
jgi:hypothetical protein